MKEEPMSDLGFTRPDLSSIRVTTQQSEFADAVRGRLSADGYPLVGDNPLAPLARAAARTLVAGFTSHHHLRYDPLHRLHRVCLTPVPAASGTQRGVSTDFLAARDLLFDREWRATCSRTCHLVTAMPGSALHAVGYPDRQRGPAGTRFVADHRGARAEAG
jgi:hypothetical protein